MNDMHTKNLTFDADLLSRLAVIAEKRGLHIDELAALAIDDFVTTEEQTIVENGTLERRWAKYLETGETVPSDKVRAKLRGYAAEAGRRMEL